jgi:hypothetical protein
VAQSARSPPLRQPDADAATPTPTINTWTYHPVPDIA